MRESVCVRECERVREIVLEKVRGQRDRERQRG